jgi:DNA repair photolyase
VLAKFDPWQSSMCTCPSKLTLNPYTGCDHGCIYCYASSYVSNFAKCRPKKDLVRRLARESDRLKGEIVSVSNSSDPYPNMEAETGLTRSCLEILSTHNCKIQIVTKSSLVVRDIDLLKRASSMIALTITTHDDSVARVLEPQAPSLSDRLRAVEKLVRNGLAVTVRIDPIIPFLNDEPEKLVKKIASLGVKHITSSTYKVRPQNWKRLSASLPSLAGKLRPLYFEEGEKVSGYLLLPRDLRVRLMERVRFSADRFNVKFGTCREGLSELNTGTCDGSWVLTNRATSQSSANRNVTLAS